MASLPGDLTATVTPAAPKGAFGDPSGAPAASWTVDGCLLAPAESSERQDRSDTVASTWKLYAPDGAVIRATDTVAVGGIVGQVQGDPEAWAGAGVVATLRRVKG